LLCNIEINTEVKKVLEKNMPSGYRFLEKQLFLLDDIGHPPG